MRARPLLFVALLASSLASPALTGCKSEGTTASPKVQLPAPLPLPADPPAAAYVASPAAVLAEFGGLLGEEANPAKLLGSEATGVTQAELGQAIADAIDPAGPWALVDLGQEELARFALRPQSLGDLERRFAALPAEGKFGAVRLPKGTREESYLAWIDGEQLAMARTLPGLVTSRDINKAYGGDPLFVVAGPEGFTTASGIERVELRGSLDDLELNVRFRPEGDPVARFEVGTGALTGLVEDPALLAGATSRYAGHAEAVRKVIIQINSTVKKQPFLLRGFLEDLARKANAVLRSWDGRFAVAVGHDGHLLVAYGSQDVKASGVAVLRLLGEIQGNVKMLRSFTREVPDVRLRKNAGKGAGEPIHTFAVSGIRGRVPAEARPLLDERGRLNMAMAFSRHASAGMVAIGREPTKAMEAWLEGSAKGTPSNDSSEHLAALAIGLPLDQLSDLEGAADIGPLLGLAPSSTHRTLIVERSGEHSYRGRMRRTGAAPSAAGRAQAVLP